MNYGQSLLTVIIPYYNREKYIPRLLQSLSNQIEVNGTVSLIFVDNNSTDSSHGIIDDWISTEMPSNFTARHLSENRQGAAAARNAALPHVDTEWVMFFDSDDEMPPLHLSEVLNMIKERPDAELFYWDIVFVDTDGKENRKTFGPHLSLIDVVIRAAWSTQRIALKKRVLEQAGGWNEELKAWNDWELSLRLLQQHPKASYVPLGHPVIVNRHGASITGSSFSQGEGRWEKSLASAREAAIKAKAKDIVELIDIKTAILAADYAREKNVAASRRLLNLLKSRGPLSLTQRVFYFWNKSVHKGVSYIIRLLRPGLNRKVC